MDNQIDNSLLQLAECEKEMEHAERDAEVYRIKKTQGILSKRRDILKDYISVEDLKYLECLNDIYVHYKVTDGSHKNPKDFSITFTFQSDDELVPNQTITKDFEVQVEEGEETITSVPTHVEWPSELSSINPVLIKQQKGKDLTKEDKKNYRLGMKSFFSWFSWTGLKPGKEFRSGEDFARLIIDDIFPYAVKYYTEALPGADEGEDTSDPEELDLEEEEEEEEEQNKRKAETLENGSKKQKV